MMMMMIIIIIICIYRRLFSSRLWSAVSQILLARLICRLCHSWHLMESGCFTSHHSQCCCMFCFFSKFSPV